MEENVALDSARQKDFVKSVRGIKKLLQKNKRKPENDVLQEKNKIKKQFRKTRGLVYLSHIPHGFYEHQMTEYFKQFGTVTNARVIRSRRTGNSKGFAFVEFREPAVAEIVAETMNNYLMGKRLIKATYIQPHKQKLHAMRKNWNAQNNPSADERFKFKKMHNAVKSDEEELKIARKLLSNLCKTKQKLKDLGIDYDFFKPVDIPEPLKEKIEDELLQSDKKPSKLVKNEATELKADKDVKEIKTEPKLVTKIEVKIEKKKKKQPKKKLDCNVIDLKENIKSKTKVKCDTQKPNNENINQNKNMDKSKKAGAKVAENFVSIKKSDSDSSIDFDSDEFEEMMENDDDDMTSADESNESEDDEIQNLTKINCKKSAASNRKLALGPVSLKKPDKTQSIKRKNIQSAPVTVKRAKFENQKKKKLKKVAVK